MVKFIYAIILYNWSITRCEAQTDVEYMVAYRETIKYQTLHFKNSHSNVDNEVDNNTFVIYTN